MKVFFAGTRGSVPIANFQSVIFGGNTTCLRVMSECLPPGFALVVDAGSGFVPLSMELLKEGIKEVAVLFTHYHHDHTQGLFLSPILFIKPIKLRLFGPVEADVGPREMLRDMMKSPYFPVDAREVASHITCRGLDFPRTWVGLFHSKGGSRMINVEEYERIVAAGQHLPIGKGKYPVDECLVVTMYKARHPESTISYRFEERPTGKVFVLLTDHENEDGIPQALKAHLGGADLLVMDSQYKRKTYDESTAGFGHGTADYCVRVAKTVGAKYLGLTHHSPFSTDADIKAILAEGAVKLKGSDLEIFVCHDYQEVDV